MSRPPLAYRELRLCSNKGAYEALPVQRLHLRLPALAEHLGRAGREVVDARVMLILQGSPELTISRDGRVLFKTTDVESARRAMEELLPFLTEAGR